MTSLLLIHTGGTISMVPGFHGLEPKAGVLEQLARTIVRQHLPDVDLDIHSFDPLIDSADTTPALWNQLIDLIVAGHQRYHGIVVTHGTDTLAYTAAALSFALSGLACPVILTGAMRPAGVVESDAVDNLLTALMAARNAKSGIRVQFAGRSMAADRVVKGSTVALDAFQEISLPDGMAPAPWERHLTVRRFAESRIAVVTLTPGLSAETFDALLAPLDGVVLRCYGSGTMPTNPRFRETLFSRIRSGLTVMVISQCAHGGVRAGEYAASAGLRGEGILYGPALTVEAAVAKLGLALSGASEQQTRPTQGPGRGSLNDAQGPITQTTESANKI